jgi:hypothetical protein
MNKLAITALIMWGIALGAFADDKPKAVAGPKGGKMLDNDKPRAEFFVDKDRRVVITFYDDEMKPVAATEQHGLVWAEPKEGRVRLLLVKKEGALVTEKPLPAGNRYNIVVRLASSANAKPQSFKIKFDTSVCKGCNLAEYACTCDDHDHDHNHQH